MSSESNRSDTKSISIDDFLAVDTLIHFMIFILMLVLVAPLFDGVLTAFTFGRVEELSLISSAFIGALVGVIFSLGMRYVRLTSE